MIQQMQFHFPQVISEYKKTYGDEELPEFLRPHVKENSRRKFLQKTKSQAIFDGKESLYLVFARSADQSFNNLF